ncbi:MAG TPA: tRNA (adenosine(37)-N6)-threonylcarbamoyltransferase complex transferase subunit TsaD [Bacteroidota bacterium]|nr:tRNA (adenosine(37)-N6)-threonylcarbamoyltransferase complex transferase subunit TsaD [Bacteroidota bacterium]
MVVLGIETSCDETSAAVLVDGVVKSNIISSQLVHAQYGGVVPELASRAHQRMIIEVVDNALIKAGVTKEDLDGVAATQGPGLVGAILVGLNFAKAMAFGLSVPFVGVNHMEGHLYSNFLAEPKPSYPFLSLIVSGGHTMLVVVDEPFKHALLGETRDDAAGEAFDKVAKMLGLGYPGGPIVDKMAKSGNPRAIAFPRSYLEEGSYDFSFSGIKTAVLYYLRNQGLLDADLRRGSLDGKHVADICASFQLSVIDVLVTKTFAAADERDIKDVTIAGGVSANSLLRSRMKEEADKRGHRLFFPPLEYCMDNGAMIGLVGWMKLNAGVTSSLELGAVANLSL